MTEPSARPFHNIVDPPSSNALAKLQTWAKQMSPGEWHAVLDLSMSRVDFLEKHSQYPPYIVKFVAGTQVLVFDPDTGTVTAVNKTELVPDPPVTPDPDDSAVATVVWHLNRLAGSLSNKKDVTLSETAAANQWARPAHSQDLALLGALNEKAGITDPARYLGLNAVCNKLAGTTDLDPARALSTIATPA